MAIVNPGEKLPAAYLERFDPAENVTYRFSVLSTSAIAIESHWIDIPSKNIKGVYQCIQGICCSAFGRRSQSYNVPIYVYRQAGSTEGDIYVLQMTPARWKKFSDLALQVDLLQYDLTFSAQKRGAGMDWSYSVLPDAKYRDYWSVEQKEQLAIAVQSFYQLGESSLVNPMNFNDWAQLLYDVGYDVQNQCWPGGQSPMNSGTSFGVIHGAVRGAIGQSMNAGSVLPPAPPSGYIPSHPQVSNINQGGVILQPPAPPAGTVSQSIPNQQPIKQGVSGNQIPAVNASIIPSTQGVGASSQGIIKTPVITSAVPLGTAPVIPQHVVSQMSSPVPPTVSQPVMQNNVEMNGVQEITAEELSKMLA